MLKIFEVNSNIVFIGTQKNKKTKQKRNKQMQMNNFFNTCCTSFFLKYVLTDQG